MQFNVTAVWNHWVPDNGKDVEGNPTGSFADTSLRGVYDPGRSTEDTSLQDQVTTQPTFILEPGSATPDAQDRLTFPAPIGVLQVDGAPDVFVSPFLSGQNKIGPVVKLKGVSG